jgi:hypothetical protein
MTEGNGRNTVPGMVADLGRSLLAALPPAFVMLVFINAAFLGAVLWFIDHQSSERAAMVEKLVDRCMSIALRTPAPP